MSSSRSSRSSKSMANCFGLNVSAVKKAEKPIKTPKSEVEASATNFGLNLAAVPRMIPPREQSYVRMNQSPSTSTFAQQCQFKPTTFNPVFNPSFDVSNQGHSTTASEASSPEHHQEQKLTEKDEEDWELRLNPQSKRPYTILTNEVREELLHLVLLEKSSIKAASKMLGLNYSTAKTILHVYKREGRITKKRKLCDQVVRYGNRYARDQEVSRIPELSQNLKTGTRDTSNFLKNLKPVQKYDPLKKRMTAPKKAARSFRRNKQQQQPTAEESTNGIPKITNLNIIESMLEKRLECENLIVK